MNRTRPRRGGIAGAISAVLREAQTPEPTGRGYYLSLTRTAMACQFEALLRPADRRYVPAVHEAFEEIERLERQLSVYRPDSEVSRLNRNAGASPVEVESGLYQLLLRARRIGVATGGAFDLTTGPLIRCWGFLDRRGRIPPQAELDAARRACGWAGLEFDDEHCAIRFRSKRVELNLGSIGKGYALERAAEILRRAGLRDFILHAGHSSVLASGNSNRGRGWEVSLRDPRGSDASLGSVCLEDKAMSTSGTAEQFFSVDGTHYGHILDPRTGFPSTRRGTVSVVANDATLAEALSTAFFVMEENEVRSYCDENEPVGVIISPLLQTHLPPFVLGVTLGRREEDPS